MNYHLLYILLLGLGLVSPTPNVHSNSSLTSVYQPLYCNKATDCWPDNDVSIDLVSCFYNSCLCMGCFTINTTTGGCQVLDCFAYDGTCVDRRQSQLATFLLSLFLSPFGVGNFYIAQWGLGAAQISLFVFFLLSCTGCCITRRLSSESRNQCTKCAKSCCSSWITFFTLSSAWCIIAWWLIDALYFGLNQRGSGNGCTLKPDL